MERPKRTRIEPVHVDEANRLRALYNAKVTVSQEAFGAEHGIGSQGMVWQYLNHRSPLNLEAALKFARALECSVADFSPRLAEALGAEAAPTPAMRHANTEPGPQAAEILSPADAKFLGKLTQGLQERDIPEHVRLSILTLIASSPEKKS